MMIGLMAMLLGGEVAFWYSVWHVTLHVWQPSTAPRTDDLLETLSLKTCIQFQFAGSVRLLTGAWTGAQDAFQHTTYLETPFHPSFPLDHHTPSHVRLQIPLEPAVPDMYLPA
jgi:hypothetical protein